jgi:hypothetical protein
MTGTAEHSLQIAVGEVHHWPRRHQNAPGGPDPALLRRAGRHEALADQWKMGVHIVADIRCEDDPRWRGGYAGLATPALDQLFRIMQHGQAVEPDTQEQQLRIHGVEPLEGRVRPLAPFEIVRFGYFPRLRAKAADRDERVRTSDHPGPAAKGIGDRSHIGRRRIRIEDRQRPRLCQLPGRCSLVQAFEIHTVAKGWEDQRAVRPER